jgi:hypothetical protein
MTEHEEFLSISSCKGTLQNLKEPVSITIANNIKFIWPTVGCPFAKETGDYHVKCVAPTLEVNISDEEAKHAPLCYQLNRKLQKI